MIPTQVSEAFKSAFENFFADKGIKWCGSCFAGYKNGLFSYVELIEKPGKQCEDIDIIYRVLPDFYVDEDTISGSKNCLYTFRMIADSLNIPVDCGLDNSERFFKICLDILKSEYDRLFFYSSVEDYAKRMVYNCNLLIEYAGKSNEFSNIYGEFPNMDFTNLAYFYLKHKGNEKCGNLIMNLISAYKILLYDKMKHGNIAELKEKLNDSEQQKLESLFVNYGRLTHFAEAMLENNIRFFAEIEKDFELKRLLGRDYIQKLLH
ncbi:MAG: hypothetical protein ACI4XI_04875 [Ruminococcus sp.]